VKNWYKSSQIVVETPIEHQREFSAT